MIKLKNVVVDVRKTVGNVTLLTDIKPVYRYQNGNRTDEVTGYKYEVCLPERHLDKLDVYIDGPKKMEEPTGNIPVEFESLVLFIGWSHYGYELKASAINIIALEPKHSK